MALILARAGDKAGEPGAEEWGGRGGVHYLAQAYRQLISPRGEAWPTPQLSWQGAWGPGLDWVFGKAVAPEGGKSPSSRSGGRRRCESSGGGSSSIAADRTLLAVVDGRGGGRAALMVVLVGVLGARNGGSLRRGALVLLLARRSLHVFQWRDGAPPSSGIQRWWRAREGLGRARGGGGGSLPVQVGGLIVGAWLRGAMGQVPRSLPQLPRSSGH